MRNWDDLKYCLALARHQKMSAAAVSLDTNVATVSRRISRLTDEVGETLFTKASGSWKPTPAAERLIGLAESLSANLEAIDETAGVPAGSTIRISCSLPLIQTNFLASATAFLTENPDINLSITLLPKSLALGEVELSVSCDEPTEGNIIRRKVAHMLCHAYASEQFVDCLEGWLQLGECSYSGSQKRYFAERFGPEPRVALEGLNLARNAIKRMPLAAILPERFALKHPELVRISNGGPVECVDIWVSYHASRRLDPLVEMAKTFVFESFAVHDA